MKPRSRKQSGYCPRGVRSELQRWWLAFASGKTRTPNWDIASTCSIEGRRGILLIEAKAHDQELVKEEAGRRAVEAAVSVNGRRNHLQIGRCIEEANFGFAGDTGLAWSLSRDRNYQMSNRFAWARKLATLGVPVMLVYLGFLRADEMSDQGVPLADGDEWERLVKRHSEKLFPCEVWGKRWTCGGQAFIPLIRSVHLALDAGAEC